MKFITLNLLRTFNFKAINLICNKFPSSGLPRCQNESQCETVLMKMCFSYKLIFMQIKLIFISKVLHEDSFSDRGKPELANGLLFYTAMFITFILNMFSLWAIRCCHVLPQYFPYGTQVSFMLMKLDTSESKPVECRFFILTHFKEQLRVLVNCFGIFWGIVN